MINPTIRKTTVLSLILHSFFITLLFTSIKKQSSFVMPSPYTVNLVSVNESPKNGNITTNIKKAQIPSKKRVFKKKAPTPVEKKKIDKPVTEKPKEEPSAMEKKIKKETPPDEENVVETKEREDLIRNRIAALKAKKEIEKTVEERSSIDMAGSQNKEKNRTKIIKSKLPQGRDSSILDEYYLKIQNHVKKQWALPNLVNDDLIAVVSFRIKRNGQIDSLKIEKSSGDHFFDRSTLKAVSKAVPLPPPPFEMEIGIRFFP